MRCKECGYESESKTQAFCDQCGSLLPGFTAPDPVLPPPTYQYMHELPKPVAMQAAPAPADPNKYLPAPSIYNRRNMALIIVLCVALVAAFMGVIIAQNRRISSLELAISSQSELPVAVELILRPPVTNGTIIREPSINELVYMPSLNLHKTHNGIDISVPADTPVLAVADGTVIEIQDSALEGVTIAIRHNDELVSVYMSLALSNVNVGDTVVCGQEIGIAGTMLVEASDGIHVHLEMLISGDYVDPREYIDFSTLEPIV